MVYTNAVPQANQQISTTQAPIEANFQFIQAAINQEHNFPVNATDPTAVYHKQASMPNQADPVALPAGTNGIYYVNGGNPKFYNGSATFLSISAQGTLIPFNGTITVGAGGTVNIIPTISGNVGGYINITRDDGKPTIWGFYKDSSNNYTALLFDLSSNTNLIWNSGTLAINSTSSNSHSFKYIGWSFPTP